MSDAQQAKYSTQILSYSGKMKLVVNEIIKEEEDHGEGRLRQGYSNYYWNILTQVGSGIQNSLAGKMNVSALINSKIGGSIKELENCKEFYEDIKERQTRLAAALKKIVSLDEIRRRKSLLDIEKYLPLPELDHTSIIMTDVHIRELVKCMPPRIEGYPWQLIYSSEDNGFSLTTLYRKMQDYDSPVLLIINTTDDQVFGALSSCQFILSDHFYGTGESFLFTFVDGFKTYSWSGSNDFFNKGSQSSLCIGAGEGSYGIWLDGDLYHGRTQNCLTYANDPLTGDKEDFIVKHIEAWGFHDGC